MINKLLPSFEVRGFRAFEHLSLEQLGRINLIVGKNNVGKSSLLEALWIYANQGSPAVLRSLLEDRDESGGPMSEFRVTDDDVENQISSLRYLFHGRDELKFGAQKMEFGPVSHPSQRLSVEFVLLESVVVDEQGNRKLREVENLDDGMDTIPGLSIHSKKSSNFVRLDRSFLRSRQDQFKSSFQMEKPSVLLPANGLSITDIGKFWDNITLGPQENDILKTLQIIEADIERVNLVGAQNSSRSRERIPIIKVRSSDNPIPLKSLGDGMNRMFGIALALVNAKNGMLLVDEIESGLHYSVHLEMWRFIFQAAKRLDVQVFATTHSWDCISAFQQAAKENEEDGMLIRLENKKGKIIPTFFDEEELAIVAREKIEVR